MNTQQIINYYTNLLIIQYADKPKAKAEVAASAEMLLMDQLILKVQDAFDIDKAEGVQLDVIGKYVGVRRSSLSEEDFRSLIRIALIKHHSDGTLYSVQNLIADWFGSHMRVYDYRNMRVSYLIEHGIGSIQLVQEMIRQDLLPVPMGVEMASIVYIPSLNNLFGFRTYQAQPENISPFNSYDDYQMGRPWLSYDDSVIF